MGKQLAYYVTVEDEHGDEKTFGPDDTVPAWAAKKITNRSAWAGSDTDDADADSSGGGADDPVPYAKRKKADLEAEVAERNEGRDDADKIEVGGNGTVKDLAAALDADDAVLDAGNGD
jgi:hypothetical protein